MKTLCAFTLTLILVLYATPSITVVSATGRAGPPLSMPVMYFPDNCVMTSVSGFTEGLIISQRGDNYQPNIACTMHLSIRGVAPSIRFTFDHMDLPEERPGHCEDYIQFFVTDSKRSDWTAIGSQICGHSTPSDIISNATNIGVLFSTNGSRQRSGFRFRFERVELSDVCVSGRGGCVSRQQQQQQRVDSAYDGRQMSDADLDVASIIVFLAFVTALILYLRRINANQR